MGLDEASSTVVTTIIVNALVGSLLILLFELNKGKKEIYAPRLRMQKNRCPPPPPTGFLAWVSFIQNINDEETLEYIGLDAFMFLRFIRFCFRLSCIAAVVGLLVLWPVYSTASVHQDGVAGVNLYTMANVSKNGDRLYASAICCWLFAIVFLLLIEEEYKDFVALRQAYLLKDDPDVSAQKRYSVFVQNIPIPYRSSDKLRGLFEGMFPGQVHSAQIARTLVDLDKCVARRRELLLELELAIAHFKASNMKARFVVRVGGGGQRTLCLGEKVDAIEHYQQQLDMLNSQIEVLRSSSFSSSTGTSTVCAADEVDGGPSGDGLNLIATQSTSSPPNQTDTDSSPELVGTPASTGFVTFTSRAACVCAYRVGTLSATHPSLRVTPAGPSSEILWENLPYSTAQRAGGKSMTRTLFTAGMIFWGSVLTFIGAISNLDSLQKYLPFIEDMDPTTYSLLAGLLPVAAMAYFLSLLPTIFAYGARHIEKAVTLSAVQVEVFHW